MRRNSPLTGRPSTLSAICWDRSPRATAPSTRATSAIGLGEVVDQPVDGRDVAAPAAAGVGHRDPLLDAAFASDDRRDALQLP